MFLKNIDVNNVLQEIWNNKTLIIVTLIFSLCGPLLPKFIDININVLLFLGLLPIVILFIFAFDAVFVVLLSLLFYGHTIRGFTLAEYFSIVFLLSFFMTFKFKLQELHNPFLFPFISFVFSTIPSFIFTNYFLESIAFSTRIILFLGIFTVIPLAFTNYKKIRNFIYIYISFVLINALDIIYLAATTGKRVFGFAGIMYVDLVGISIVILLVDLLYNEKNRILKYLVLLVQVAALVFTQTRGAWIVTFAVVLIVLISFIVESPKFGYNRRKISKYIMFSLILVAMSVFLLKDINPGTFARVGGLSSKSKEVITNDVGGISSLATRFFIWKTAWNAFLKHPVFGIGFYTFPYASAEYSTISPLLYKAFVRGLTPHTTTLAILTEIGVVGAFGFLFFIISIFRKLKNNFQFANSFESKLVSRIIFWAFVYIMFAMVVTDAWLWGRLFILWGILLGFASADSKIQKTIRS